MKIKVVKNILDANQQIADENERAFGQAGLITINIMASPGAGKTSLILKTIDLLGLPVAVIEGDIASTFDAEKVGAKRVPVVQINTGGACHLDAAMVRKAVKRLNLKNARFLFIENVGNLVCPASFDLGEQAKVVVASVPEGDDKPYKYPGMFSAATAVVLNKIDTLPVIDFEMKRFKKGVKAVNPDAPIFELSCKTGEGLNAWITWLKKLAN
ncbi:MAG: hypB [Deltaproteobacteria bacterium]|nr:hypB [Deltaproteobacteria bacterium]